jgi:hypothetical protein
LLDPVEPAVPTSRAVYAALPLTLAGLAMPATGWAQTVVFLPCVVTDVATAVRSACQPGGGAPISLVANGVAGSPDYSSTDLAFLRVGKDGGAGSAGADLLRRAQVGTLPLATTGADQHAVDLQSQGGRGGGGEPSFGGTIDLGVGSVTVGGFGGAGGAGGKGADITLASLTGELSTTGKGAAGVRAVSAGGNGGFAGASTGLFVKASDGGAGGQAGNVTVNSAAQITTAGEGAHGILATSIGGMGGIGSGVAALIATPGNGGLGGAGGTAAVLNEAEGVVVTTGAKAWGVVARSRGGASGAAGGSVTLGGDAQALVCNFISQVLGSDGLPMLDSARCINKGADAGTASAANDGLIRTSGATSHALVAESRGGEGGNGGDGYGLVAATGSLGSLGGNGGRAEVLNRGSLLTTGSDAIGALASSRGGEGGRGGGGYASTGVGGGGAPVGSDAGSAQVVNLGVIETTGKAAYGVLVESVGGGLGDGGDAIGIVTQGGNGGGGGNGGSVTALQSGRISTQGTDADGLIAQSVGGGGGAGGSASSGGLVFSAAFGGAGGGGGNGGEVYVGMTSLLSTGDLPAITTQAANADGLRAQSIGGGGGSGGDAVAASAGPKFSASVASRPQEARLAA